MKHQNAGKSRKRCIDAVLFRRKGLSAASGLRVAVFLIMAGIALTAGVGYFFPRRNQGTDEEKFSSALTYATMRTYVDPFYGYSVSYPSVFTLQPDSLNDAIGQARFRYCGDGLDVVHQCNAFCIQNCSLQTCVDSLASVLHATHRQLVQGNFILQGSQHEDGDRIEGYVYYAKFVQCDKFLFACTLVYPLSYKKSVGSSAFRNNVVAGVRTVSNWT